MNVISGLSRDSFVGEWRAKTNGSMLMNKKCGSGEQEYGH